MVQSSKKTKWETGLSCDEHVRVEAHRRMLDISRAAFVRAALTSGHVLNTEAQAGAAGLAGEVLFGLEQFCSCEMSDIDIFGVRDRQRELVALLMQFDE